MNWILGKAILNWILYESFFGKIQILNWIRLDIVNHYVMSDVHNPDQHCHDQLDNDHAHVDDDDDDLYI